MTEKLLPLLSLLLLIGCGETQTDSEPAPGANLAASPTETLDSTGDLPEHSGDLDHTPSAKEKDISASLVGEWSWTFDSAIGRKTDTDRVIDNTVLRAMTGARLAISEHTLQVDKSATEDTSTTARYDYRILAPDELDDASLVLFSASRSACYKMEFNDDKNELTLTRVDRPQPGPVVSLEPMVEGRYRKANRK